jgi:hypothetical protein
VPVLLVDVHRAAEHHRGAERRSSARTRRVLADRVLGRWRRLVRQPLDQLVARRSGGVGEHARGGVRVVDDGEDPHPDRMYPWPTASEDSS